MAPELAARIAGQFADTAAGYLDTASIGLPPRVAVEELAAALPRWQRGELPPPAFDPYADRCRDAFARLAGVPLADVALASVVSTSAALVAGALPAGARIVLQDAEFTSVLAPFLAARERGVRVDVVPFAELPAAVVPGVDLVAFSAVRSQDGLVADLDAIATAAEHAGAATFVDATHGLGWLPIDVARFDYVAVAAYKWLLCPKGVAFLVVSPRRRAALPAAQSGWYSLGDDRWTSLYGEPLHLAPDARRFDLTPAWLAYVGGAAALELLADLGSAAIGAHDVALANRFRAGLGLAPSDSAIVAVEHPEAAERFAAAGIRAAGRDGHVRAAFHLYTTTADADRALAALATG